MTTTPADLIAYYQNLLIIQYKNLTKAAATVGAIAQQVIADLIHNQVRDAFDLATAIGAQLDLLGAYVGARRLIAGFTPSGILYMLFPAYADATPANTGMAQYADVADPVDFWLLYSAVSTIFTLSDGLMSQLIQYLIAVHASDTTNSSVDLILEKFFGNYVTLTDNENMTITYTHDPSDPNIFFALINYLNLLPRPSGVGIIVV